MKYILVLLLSFVSCTSGGQKEKDLEQILTILLDDADNFASSYTRYYATKKFAIEKLSKGHPDIKEVSSHDWESKYENRIPKGEEWRGLVSEAINIKNENDLIFRLGQAGEYFLIPGKEFDKLSREGIDGVISISDLAFNKQRNRVVIYVAFLCGGECGYGQLYFFSKENQNWKVVGARGFWIAFNPVDVFSKNIKKATIASRLSGFYCFRVFVV
ncbi:MAG: hypothetical protein AAF992_25700 [Bacteroidota bacterium]